MPSVQIRENEPFEIALRRFKRGCEKAGKIAAATKRYKRKVSMSAIRKKPPYKKY